MAETLHVNLGGGWTNPFQKYSANGSSPRKSGYPSSCKCHKLLVPGAVQRKPPNTKSLEGTQGTYFTGPKTNTAPWKDGKCCCDEMSTKSKWFVNVMTRWHYTLSNGYTFWIPKCKFMWKFHPCKLQTSPHSSLACKRMRRNDHPSSWRNFG